MSGVIGRLNTKLAHIFWHWIGGWAAAHPDIVLSDPKRGGRRNISVSFPREFDIDGKRLVVDLQNQRQYKRWRGLSGRLEAGLRGEETVTGWLVRHLRADSVLYDIGANVGNITGLAGLLQPEARILSFEPEPNSFLQICRLIRDNGLNAMPYPLAISNRVSVDTFNVNIAFEAALSNHQFGRAVINTGTPMNTAFSLGAASFSVDTLVFDHGLPRPTLVKIDVDGIEPDVIAGMERTLADGSIESLVTEVTGEENAHKIVATLEGHGYRCSHGIPAGLGNHSYDIIFDRDAGT